MKSHMRSTGPDEAPARRGRARKVLAAVLVLTGLGLVGAAGPEPAAAGTPAAPVPGARPPWPARSLNSVAITIVLTPKP